MKKPLQRLAFSTAVTFALYAAGPAFAQEGTPSPEITVTGGYQQMWARGSATERAGIAALAKAQEKLAEADRDIAEATSRQDHGSNNADNATGEFNQTSANAPNNGDSAEAVKWAKQAASNAKRWKKGEQEQKRGAADMRSAQKQRKRAEAALIKAQAQIDAGRAKMAEAQRRSLPQS